MLDRMPRIVLHIGCEKTGTTSIQQFLSRERDFLMSKGILFPRVPAGNASEPNHKLLTLCVRRSNVEDLRATVPDVDTKIEHFLSDFAAEIAESAYHTIILSNEHCSSRLPELDQIGALKRLLLNFSENIDVIVYIRRQDKLLWSMYSTSLKSGNVREFVYPNDINSPLLNFKTLLDRWSEVFCVKNIHVRSYDDVILNGGDVVHDFLATAGLADLFGPLLLGESVTNRSLDGKTLEFLRLFNKYVPYLVDGRLNEQRGNIMKCLESISGKDDGPQDEQAGREFLERFRDSNAYVARKYLGRQNGQAFPEDWGSAASSDRELSVEDAVRIAAHLWIDNRK